jgi:cell wall-associated NlpC family hydrolase
VQLIRLAFVAMLFALAIPDVSGANTTTQNENGVELIVSTPDTPSASKPKSRSSAKQAVARIENNYPSDTNKRYTNALIENAQALTGRPYVFGGTTPSGFDCSGYTQYVFATVGIHIPRTADAQFAAGRKIAGDPLPGDLVFFQTYDYGASHVALYLGGGHFINAIGSNVHEADFNSPYFRGRYLGARRFLPD